MKNSCLIEKKKGSKGRDRIKKNSDMIAYEGIKFIILFHVRILIDSAQFTEKNISVPLYCNSTSAVNYMIWSYWL